MLRAIYVFHRYVRGWHDIGYNFVLDRFGRMFEARAGGIDEAVVGAHAGGYNLYSTGVAVLGTYSEPSDLRRRAAARSSSCCPGSSRFTASGSWAAWWSPSTRPGPPTAAIRPAAKSRCRVSRDIATPTPPTARGRPLRRAARDPDPRATRSPAPPRRPPSRPGREGCWARSRCSTARRWRRPAADAAGALGHAARRSRGREPAWRRRSPTPKANGRCPWLPRPRRRRLRALFAGAALTGRRSPKRSLPARPRPSRWHRWPRPPRRRAEGRAPASRRRLPAPGVRGAGALTGAAAHSRSSPYSRSVSPSRGSVATSSVGLVRAAAQRRQASLKQSSTQASAPVSGEALDRLELPVGARVPGLPLEAQIRQPGGQPEQPRQVFLGPLLPAAGPNEVDRAVTAQAGVRPPWPKGNGPCRRPRAGSPAACRECRP